MLHIRADALHQLAGGRGAEVGEQLDEEDAEGEGVELLRDAAVVAVLCIFMGDAGG